jgi:hypothetical protein
MTSSVYLTSNSTKVAARWRKMARKMPNVLDDGVKELSQEALLLYQQTTRTWTHQPTFTAQRESTARWRVETDDKIYGYIDRGTRVRRALMSRDWRSKTKPNVIASYNGRGRVLYISRKLNLPGIKARNFSKRIRERIQPKAANKLREKLLSATSGPGVGL